MARLVNDMDIMEMFMLTAVDTRHRILYNYGSVLANGLSGIAVIELIRRGRLAFEDRRLIVRDAAPTRDELLDEALQLLSAKTAKRLESWIVSLPYKIQRFSKRVMERLEDNGMIRIDSERFLGLIPYTRYTVTNESERNRIVNAVRDVLLKGSRTAEREIVLIVSIATACGFVEKYFSREERKGMRETFKQLKKGTYFETADDEAMKQVVKAIQRVLDAVHSATIAAGA